MLEVLSVLSGADFSSGRIGTVVYLSIARVACHLSF